MLAAMRPYRPFLLGALALAPTLACGRSDLLLEGESFGRDSGTGQGASSGASGSSGSGSGNGGDGAMSTSSSSGSGGSGRSASSSSSSSSGSSGGDIFTNDNTGDDAAGGSTSSGGGVPCGPDTCAGCCSRGVCMGGRSRFECGNRGVECVACDVEKGCGPGQFCQ